MLTRRKDVRQYVASVLIVILLFSVILLEDLSNQTIYIDLVHIYLTFPFVSSILLNMHSSENVLYAT